MINRRYVILGLALAAAIIGFDRYYVMPRAVSMQEELVVAYAGLKKDENFVKSASAPGKDGAAFETEMKNLEKRLIPEKTEFLASVRLQDEVSAMSERAGLRLSTTRTLPAEKLGSYLTVPLYMEGNGNIRQLSDFLKYLETGTFLIKPDKLTVNITNMQNPKEVKFKVQVSGLARP